MKLLLADAAERLGHENQFVAWDFVLFDCLRNHPLRISVGIDVGCIPLFPNCQYMASGFPADDERGGTHRVHSAIVGRLEQWESLFRPDDPICPFWISNAHTSHDRNRNPEAAVSNAFIVDFCFLQGLRNTGG